MTRLALTHQRKRLVLKWVTAALWAGALAIVVATIYIPDFLPLRGLLIFDLALAASLTSAMVVSSFIVPLEQVYRAAVEARREGLHVVGSQRQYLDEVDADLLQFRRIES